MDNPIYAPRWLIEQAQAEGIDTTGYVALDKLAPFQPTGPMATTEGVKRVLIRLAATEGMPLFWRDYFRNQHD